MKKIVLIFLIIISTLGFAVDKTVTIGVFDWDPLVSTTMTNYGFISEIADAAFRKAGYQVNFVGYPLARLLLNIEKGSVDAALGISANDERRKIMDFSNPFYKEDYGFFHKKGKVNYTKLSDLNNYEVGVLRDSFWEGIFNRENIKFKLSNSMEINFEKLIDNRQDITCSAKEIGIYTLKKLIKKEEIKNYDFIYYLTFELSLSVSKKTNKPNLMKDFEKGLEMIKKDGTYDKLIKAKDLYISN